VNSPALKPQRGASIGKNNIVYIRFVPEEAIELPNFTAKRLYFNRRSAEPITASVSWWQTGNNTLSPGGVEPAVVGKK